MRHLYIYILVSLFKINEAQINIVPNSSFEDTMQTCSNAMYLSVSKFWYSPSNTSPDYFSTNANKYGYPYYSTVPNSCYGYQQPRTGSAFAGIGTYIVTNYPDTTHYFSEYISIELTDSLKSSHIIYAEFYISLANLCEYGTNRIGLLLTQTQFTTSLGSFTNTIQPQIEFDTTQFFIDTLNWVKVSGTFTAQGGEKYLTIGSFKDGDYIKKTKINSSFTSSCSLPADHKFSYLYIDDVKLYDSTTIGIKENEKDDLINLYPNPASTFLNIDIKHNNKLELQLYNVIGELVLSKELDNHTVLDIGNLANGVYMYKLLDKTSNVKTGKLLISK